MIFHRFIQTMQWVLLLLFTFHAGSAAADNGIHFSEFSLRESSQPRVLLANAQLDYELTDYLREGLLNGMTLRSEILFTLQWHNNWWWNTHKTLASVKTELKYHALSQHYQLVRLDTNENWNFPTLNPALDKMGSLSDYALPTLPKNAYHNDAAIFVTARLSPQSLELPLRIQNLFSDHYSLSSEGIMWPLP